MRTMHAVAFGLAMTAFASSAQTVFRCTGANGEPVFQDSPCTDGKGVVVPVAPAGTNVMPVQPADIAAQKRAVRDSAVRSAIARRDVVDGMTEDEVVQSLGSPIVANTDSLNGRVTRKLVYRYPDGSARNVYVGKEGVYAVQDRPAVATQPCHSDLDIRNAEVGVNSQSRTERERAEIRKRVAEMRRCRR